MLRKVKGSFSRVFNITFHNFDVSYESKINEALIEFDVKDNTRKDLYCELTMSAGWNHGRVCGMTRFGIYISNYKEMSDGKPYNVSRVVMLEDTTTQIMTPKGAGFNVTVNPDYFIGDKFKLGRFGIRVLHVAKASEENDVMNSVSLYAECKLEVFTHGCEIENIKIITGWNEFDVNKYGKMFIGDYCDYYLPITDFLDIKYPNGNIYDDNGIVRYKTVLPDRFMDTNFKNRANYDQIPGTDSLIEEKKLNDFHHKNSSKYTSKHILYPSFAT